MRIYLKNKHTLQVDDFNFKCCIGKNGLSYRKIEGDKKTPIGTFEIEKLYLLDLAQMALWSDEILEIDESIFLNKIKEKLNINKSYLIESTTTINKFIKEYKSEIPFFNYSNPASC